MAHILAAVTMILLGVGTMTAGTDLMEMMIGVSQVATERLTMNQIGKSIFSHNATTGGKLAYEDLPEFIRTNIMTGGSRDPAKDLWGTYYYLENNRYAGYPFKPRGDEFVLCSAGPDREWWNVDDETWMSFNLPEQYRDRLPKRASIDEGASEAMGALQSYREAVARQFEELGKTLGVGQGEE